MSVVINHKIIGQNIRHAREKQQLLQKQFAAYLGVSSSYAGRIERGVNKLNISLLYDVSLVLHTPLSELLCGCCPQAALGSLSKKPYDEETAGNTANGISECGRNYAGTMRTLG